MRFSSSAAVAAALSGASATITYGNTVTGMSLQNIGPGAPGPNSLSYQMVSDWDSASGKCSQTPRSYTGSLSPLDEEVSMHFQGPLHLKQFAVYTPSAGKKAKRDTLHSRRHGHQAFHDNAKVRELQERAIREEAEKAQLEQRAVGDMVYVTTNGQVWSWTNAYAGPAATAAGGSGSGAPAPSDAPASTTAASGPAASAPASSANAGSSESAPAPAPSGDWSQVAYLDTKSSKSKSFGLSFLNKLGTLDAFGLQLSYAAPDGTSNTASQNSVPESGYYIPSNSEVVVMTDNKCAADGSDCLGKLRTPDMSYHGFHGANKAFFMEFDMPLDGDRSGNNGDKPAIWMLNAQVPRSVQFGNPNCSCWDTGCGELDVFEVLESGNDKATVTLHSNIPGGGNGAFARPTGGAIKFAVVLYNDAAYLQVLDDKFDFGSTMSADAIDQIVKSTSSGGGTVDVSKLIHLESPVWG
ncbi:MAG: target of Sbf [Bogoriella megaspora]|nr:MAG: target of Sbf [Bogoriella megaspora]